MTGLEVFARALLGSVIAAGAKRAKTWLIGDAEMNELIKVGEQGLDSALDMALSPYPGHVERAHRQHLRSVLDRAIGLVAEPEALFPATSDPTLRRQRLRQLVDKAHESQDLDWSTFQVVVGGATIRLDETQVLLDFLTDLPTRISAHARAHNSVLHEFSTEGHLVEMQRLLLQLQSDVTLVLTRTITLDWEQAGPRAIELQRGYLDRRRLVEDHRTPYIKPSATVAWETVHSRRDWPAVVLSEVRKLRSELNHYLGEASGARLLPLVGFDGAATASAAHAALRNLRLDSAEVELAEESHRRRQENEPVPREAGEQDPAADRTIGRTLVRVRWLKEQVRRPRFDVTMGLVGGFGSGRSALLTHIGEKLTAAGEYVVFLDLRDVADIDLAVVTQAGRLFGATFAAIEDLENFLSIGDRVLHVLIDDFDIACDRHPQLAQGLAGLIDHATAARRLVFAAAIDEANIEKVLLGNDPYFWSRYGYTTDAVHDRLSTGWWDLGQSNIVEHQGLRILAAAKPSESHDVDQIVTDPGAFEAETTAIANPLAAWLRIQAHDESNPAATPVTDVNQAEFVAAYWGRLQTSGLAGRRSDTIDACVTELARAFGLPRITKLALEDLVAPRAEGGNGLSSDDLSLLIVAGLLLRHDGDVEVGQSALVQPRFAPLWGYRIARLLVFEAEKADGWAAVQGQVHGWQERARAGEPLGEAVCQFILALLESSDHSSSASLWQEWAAGRRTPKGPLLLASVGASPATQRSVIDQLEDKRFKPGTKRELFLLMRFVARCQLPDWAGDRRLMMVQRRFGRVAECGLQSYLHLVLLRVLTTPVLVSEENYVRTLESLVGLDASETAEFAADLSVQCGRRIFDGDLGTWLVYLLRLCRRVAPAPSREHVGRSKSRGDSKRKVQKRAAGQLDLDLDPFLHALYKRVAAEVVASDPSGSYRIAVSTGWCSAWDRGVANTTAKTMRNELNTAMGATFHRQGGDTTFVDSYIGLVADLVRGHIPDAALDDQREWAFFLIRNSAVTHGKAEVEVDERFHALLRILAGDRELTRRLRKWAEPLYRANGIRA
jgi:hypothetical protein